MSSATISTQQSNRFDHIRYRHFASHGMEFYQLGFRNSTLIEYEATLQQLHN